MRYAIEWYNRFGLEMRNYFNMILIVSVVTHFQSKSIVSFYGISHLWYLQNKAYHLWYIFVSYLLYRNNYFNMILIVSVVTHFQSKSIVSFYGISHLWYLQNKTYHLWYIFVSYFIYRNNYFNMILIVSVITHFRLY